MDAIDLSGGGCIDTGCLRWRGNYDDDHDVARDDHDADYDHYNDDNYHHNDNSVGQASVRGNRRPAVGL